MGISSGRTGRHKHVVCNIPNWNLDRTYVVLIASISTKPKNCCQVYNSYWDSWCMRTTIFCYDFKHWASYSAHLILSKMVAFLAKMAIFEIEIMFGILRLPPAPIPVFRFSHTCVKRERSEDHLVPTANDLLFWFTIRHVKWSQLCFDGSFETEHFKLSWDNSFKLLRGRSVVPPLNQHHCLHHLGFSSDIWCPKTDDALPCMA